MYSKILISCVVLSLVFNFACSQSTLSCYDCDPTNTQPNGDCGKPAETNVRSAICSLDPSVVNGTNICASIYIIAPLVVNATNATASSNNTGIYRGCQTLAQDVGDFCDWYIQEHKTTNYTIKSCISCNTTRCNIHGFRADGTSSGYLNMVNLLLFYGVLIFASAANFLK